MALPTGTSNDSLCVVAFDLDNTLLDADARGYAAAVHGLLEACPLGLSTQDARDALEAVRAAGGALERIGLRSPVHDRANPDALAALILTRCVNDALHRELATNVAALTDHRRLVDELVALYRPAARGPWALRLEGETRLRRFLASDPRVQRFRDAVAALADHPRLAAWSSRYRELELEAPAYDHRPLFAALTARGVCPVVISHGKAANQREKLRRLKLDEVLSERAMITEDAASVPGCLELDAILSRLFDVTVAEVTRGADQDELRFLWRFHCVLDEWSRKTPAFYGRCLHAIQIGAERPASALRARTHVPRPVWSERPLRFVMIGDRHAQDVAPVQTLLGAGVGMTLRLRMGKYADRDDSAPGEAASRTFSDWTSLTRFLLEDFDSADVVAITEPPPSLPTSTLDAAAIERGLDSPLEVVRHIAHLAARMTGERGIAPSKESRIFGDR